MNKTHAALMVMWGLAFIPVMAVNVLSEIAALTLLRGADFLSSFDQPHREGLAMLFLELHRYGYVVGWIFGPWLFHLGVLIYRSGFLPRLLGVLLIAAGFGYLADSVTPLLLPGYANVMDRFASIPLMLGEPALILWLLIIGAKDQPLRAAARNETNSLTLASRRRIPGEDSANRKLSKSESVSRDRVSTALAVALLLKYRLPNNVGEA